MALQSQPVEITDEAVQAKRREAIADMRQILDTFDVTEKYNLHELRAMLHDAYWAIHDSAYGR